MKLSILFAAVLLTFNVAAHADSVNVNIDGKTYTLNSNQVEDIKSKDSPATASDTSTLKEVSDYAGLGKQIGIGVAEAAKSMGVAIKDFSETPMGKVTMTIIVFKLIGLQILRLLIGLLWFAVVIPIWYIMAKRICIVQAKTVTGSGRDKKVEYQYYNTNNASGEMMAHRFFALIVAGIITIVGLAVMFP